MKPNFALNLSHEGISLLQRADAGWLLVGDVSLQDEEFNDKIRALRQTADMLGAGQVTTKLVIPTSQILFRQVEAPGPDGLQRNQQIRQELDGATPYDVADLAFDWCEINGQVHVAAVAKETLQEAEGFALEHGFNPLSFVAIPNPNDFSGEPYFGTSKSGQNLLGAGTTILRDEQVIVVTGTAKIAPPKIEAPAPKEPVIQPEQLKTQIADTKADIDLAAPEPLEQIADSPKKQEPEKRPTDTTPVSPTLAEPKTASAEAKAGQPDPVAPVTANILAAELPKADAPIPPKSTPEKDAPVFSSRRDNTAVPDADPAKKIQPSELDKLDSRLAVLPDGSVSRAPKLGGANRTAEFSKTTEVPAEKPQTTPAPQKDEPPVSKPVKNKTKPKKITAKKLIQAAAVKATAMPTSTNSKTTNQHAPTDEKQKMTVFGARKTKNIKGKPRFLGLGLLLLLLLCFAALILWSSYFLSDKAAFWRSDDNNQTVQTGRINQPSKIGTNSGNDPVGNAVAMLGEPTISAPPLLTPDVAARLPQELSEPEAPTDFEPAPKPEPEIAENPPEQELPAQPAQPLTVAQAQTHFDDTGIWQRAPDVSAQPETDNSDNIYLTSVDPKISWQDAVSLPVVSRNASNQPLDSISSPAKHSTQFVMDERGLVLATPQGSLTPDGVRVFAGAPAILPVRRPAAFVIAAPAVADTLPAKIRPKSRPKDLVEQTETEQLGGRSRAELAAFRPKPRPADLKVAIKEPEVVKEPEEPEVAEELNRPPSAQDVVLSSFPNHRPRNFQKIVALSRAAQPSTTTKAAAAVPRSQTITPTGRTTASVARLATTKNALRLKRTSLIGVYGSPSKRRALVRLANGRYVKVKVGQRVDGGKVAAIGAHELRYVKGGRTIVLKMPKS